GNPAAAIETSRRVPPSVRADLESRPDYSSKMAMAFYATGQTDAADQTVQRVLADAARKDSEAALNARLEIAGMLTKQGHHDRAIPIYQQAVQAHPDNVPAWQGLIGAYTELRDFSRVRAAVGSMPREAFDKAGANFGFLDAAALAYSTNGSCAEA